MKSAMRIFLVIFFAFVLIPLCGDDEAENKRSCEKWYSWALFNRELGKLDKSREFAEKALELNPYHEGAFLLLADIRKENPSLVTKWEKLPLPELATTDKTAVNWYYSGLERYFKKDYVRALFCFRQALTQIRDDEAINIMYYRTRFRVSIAEMAKEEQRDLQGLRDKIIKEKKHDPEMSYYWFLLGKYHYEHGEDQARGLDCFEIALALNNENKELTSFLSSIEEEKMAEEERQAEAEKEKLARMEQERIEREQISSEARLTEVSEETIPVRDLEKEKQEREKLEEQIRIEAYKATIDIPELTLNEYSPKEKTEEVIIETVSPLEKARKKVYDLFKEGQKHLDERNEPEVLTELELAFKVILEHDPDDLAATYYLLLIYKKREQTALAVEQCVALMNKLNSFRYQNSRLQKDARAMIDCFVRSVVLQASVEAFNNREKKILDMRNFKVRLLEKYGYLKRREREVELHLKTPEGKKFDATWKVPGNRCSHPLSYYKMNYDELIECSEHGLSPFLMENVLVQEYD